MAFAFAPAGTTRFSLGPSSGTCVALPAVGRNVRIANLGPSDCYVKLTSTFTSSTVGTFAIMARTVELFDRQANTYITGIASGGSTVLDVTTGEGGA